MLTRSRPGTAQRIPSLATTAETCALEPSHDSRPRPSNVICPQSPTKALADFVPVLAERDDTVVEILAEPRDVFGVLRQRLSDVSRTRRPGNSAMRVVDVTFVIQWSVGLERSPVHPLCQVGGKAI